MSIGEAAKVNAFLAVHTEIKENEMRVQYSDVLAVLQREEWARSALDAKVCGWLDVAAVTRVTEIALAGATPLGRAAHRRDLQATYGRCPLARLRAGPPSSGDCH